ncbi:MAG: KH domain-containing protein [Candidatus Aenigmatarchaeota archaeon]
MVEMIEYLAIPEERIKLLKKNKSWVERLKKFCNAELNLNEEIGIKCEDPLMLLRVKNVLKAFGRGFSFEDALTLLDEDYFFETIEVKEYAGKSRKRQIVLKGRVIGREGKIKKMIERICNVKIVIYGKTISIIGKWNDLEKAKKAVEMLLEGKKHGTVYNFLERQRGS